MAYFAQLDSNNIVQQINVVNDDELKKKMAFWDPAGLFVDDNEHEDADDDNDDADDDDNAVEDDNDDADADDVLPMIMMVMMMIM